MCKYIVFLCNFRRRDINHIHHLLSYARKIFYSIDTMNAVNEDAAKL